MSNNDNNLGGVANTTATQQPVTYRVAAAPAGYCVVMTDETGRRTVVDAGSRSYERTKKIADRLTRLEAKARATLPAARPASSDKT